MKKGTLFTFVLPLFLTAFLTTFLAKTANAQNQSALLEVYQILKNKCQSCHSGATPAAGLDFVGTGATDVLKAQSVANKLKNGTPANAVAAQKGMKNIYAGRPDKSFLWKKINQKFDAWIPELAANEGNTMPGPAYSGAPLTETEKEMVRQWIVFGAKNTGWAFDRQSVVDFYALGGEKAYPDGPPAAPSAAEGFQVRVGPFFMKADTEVEYYQKYELALPSDLEVNRIDTKISAFSHHLIIYNWTDNATAATIQHGLRTNSFHSDINLVAALQEATDLKLPASTAFKWKKDIILDLNTHYINYSATKVYQAEAYVNVYTQPNGTAAQEMFASLVPYVFFDPIPNSGNEFKKTAIYQQASPIPINVWGLMGHTHKWGKSYKIWQRNPNGTAGEQLYDAACNLGEPNCFSPNYDYKHIPMRYFWPLKPVDISSGFIHEATWENNGAAPVFWGNTSDDEMMVMIAFWTLFPIVTDVETPLEKAHSIAVLPNPTSGDVVVKTADGQKIRLFRLLDLAGKEVFRAENAGESTFSFSTEALPSGVFVWQADGEAGKLVILK